MTNLTSASPSLEYEFPVIPLVVTLGVVSLGTVVGNSLVCMAIYTHPALKHVTYFSIFSLAVVDFLVGLVAVPSYIIKKLVTNASVTIIVCDTFRFSYFLTGYTSILSLCVISVDRLIAVKEPLSYQTRVTSSRMKGALLFVWFDACLISLLPFVPWEKESKAECHYEPTRWWSIMVIITNVIIPFCFIVSCYTYMYTVAQSHIKKISNTTHKVSRGEKCKELKERKANITIMIVIGLFVICWFPSTIYYFLQKVCKSCFTSNFKTHQGLINALVKLFTFASSFCNPIIYCWRSRDFRKAFINFFMIRKRNLSSSLRDTTDAVINLFGNSRKVAARASQSSRKSWTSVKIKSELDNDHVEISDHEMADSSKECKA